MREMFFCVGKTWETPSGMQQFAIQLSHTFTQKLNNMTVHKYQYFK
jgi:hypothetical protein